MEVKQLIGPYAGQIVEMDFHVAQSNVANGTAEWVGEPPDRVRGAEPSQAAAEDPPATQDADASGEGPEAAAAVGEDAPAEDPPATQDVDASGEGPEAAAAVGEDAAAEDPPATSQSKGKGRGKNK